jgi:membrane-bound serine protease (ClpP class)
MTLAILIGSASLLFFYFEFFLPGGILALLGTIVLIGGAVLFFFETGSPLFSFVYVLGFLLLAGLMCYLALKHIRKSGKKDSFFLQKDQAGYSSAKMEEDLTGKEGVVSTELKPAGHVRIEEKVYQAVSQGSFLSKGSVIEVVQMKGSHVVVKLKK